MVIVREPLPNAKEGVYRCDKKLSSSSACWRVTLLTHVLLEDFSFIYLLNTSLAHTSGLVAFLNSGCSFLIHFVLYGFIAIYLACSPHPHHSFASQRVRLNWLSLVGSCPVAGSSFLSFSGLSLLYNFFFFLRNSCRIWYVGFLCALMQLLTYGFCSLFLSNNC